MCQACFEQIKGLERLQGELAARDIKLVSVTPDSPAELRQAFSPYSIKTPMIADDNRDMSRAFKVLGPRHARRHAGARLRPRQGRQGALVPRLLAGADADDVRPTGARSPRPAGGVIRLVFEHDGVCRRPGWTAMGVPDLRGATARARSLRALRRARPVVSCSPGDAVAEPAAGLRPSTDRRSVHGRSQKFIRPSHVSDTFALR